MQAQRKNIEHISVALILSIMAFLMISSIAFKSRTSDEDSHLRYGIKMLNFNSDKVDGHDNSKMPFSIFNAIAVTYARNILNFAGKGLKENIREHLAYSLGRLITIIFALLLGLYVFKWTKELYGSIPAILSLILYAFSPNIIAHSRLITTDLYAALMVTLSAFYFWKFIRFGGWKRAILSASMLGVSQLTKYSCLFLYPIFIIIVLIRYSHLIFRLIIEENIKELFKCFKVFLKYIVLFLFISALIINIGFLFNKTFTPLSKYEFKSDLFKALKSIPGLERIPVPLPYPFFQGLDMLKFHENNHETYKNIYLLGKLKTKDDHPKGFKGYYFYAFLFKEPIPIQLFILFSIMILILNRKSHDFLKNELFLLIPVLFFTVYYNFFVTMNIGIRHMLVISPLLYIFCGNLFKKWISFDVKIKSILIFLLIYLAISVLSYFPHYLSYFNEIVWDRKQAYKLLADSNIDWGQNSWYLRKYREKNPEIKILPEFPTSGKIVVSVNHLVGISDPERYKWLLQNFEPVDTVAYSYLVYDIFPEDLERISKKYQKKDF
ncbi:MAG: glycosyltransferase family 39 protein [Candidatus Omnitrophica bacterium]|nr:glycosyltransferase family 39 protein [Candidatus Omnitrophota bacterium]